MKTVTFDDSAYRLVPVELTEEMRVAGNIPGWLRDKWAAMLSAAPSAPATEAGEA